MNEEKFWQVVERVNWYGTWKRKDAVDVGKAVMLTVLPTKEDMDAFRKVYSEKQGKLYSALETWEKEDECWHTGHNPRSFGLGDDSFGDLIAHVIGCGREEYDAVMRDPERAHKRALSYDFGESFSYCIPWDDDYDPVEKKLERAQSGLDHWISRMAEDPSYSTARSEVERRAMEVAKLQAQLDGGEVDPVDVNALVRKAQFSAQERLVAHLREQYREVEKMLKDAEAGLEELQE